MEEFKNTINGTDQMQSIQTNPMQGQQAMQNPNQVQGQQAMQNPNPMQGQQAMQNPNPVQGNPAMPQMNYQQAVNVYNQNPADYYRKQREEKRRWDKIEGNLAFQRIGIPSLIYAVIYAFCWYKNSAGILNLIFTVFLAGYILLVVNRNKLELKKLTVFLLACMILLGVSNFLTANGTMIFYNNTGVFLLSILTLLHQFYDDREWNLGKYFTSIFAALGNALGLLDKPFSELSYFLATKKEVKGNVREEQAKRTASVIKYVLIGIAIALPILFVVVGLLSAADAIFGDMVDGIFSFDWLLKFNIWNIILVLILFFFGYMSAYAGVRVFEKKKIKPEAKVYKKHSAIVAGTVLGLIAAVYLFFCAIQILFLFGGLYNQLGKTNYADSARNGFFELLAVCLINLVIVLCTMKYFDTKLPVKILMLVISACTFIMIASSAYRMYLYVWAYDLTFLRISVFWGLAVIALEMTGIVIYILCPRFPLFFYGLVTFCFMFLVFSFSKPDYLIARYNLDHMTFRSVETGKDLTEVSKEMQGDYDTPGDLDYIVKLSEDAAPVIAEYAGKLGWEQFCKQNYDGDEDYTGEAPSGSFWLIRYHFRMEDKSLHYGWRNYNLSRQKAYDLFTR